VIAAMAGDPKAVVSESADLIFHLGVLLADMGLTFADVAAELDRRAGCPVLPRKLRARNRASYKACLLRVSCSCEGRSPGSLTQRLPSWAPAFAGALFS